MDMNYFSVFARQTALIFIRIYQIILSPDHGIFSSVIPYQCKHQPTCSQYCYQAVEKYGFLKGIYLGGRRILRCHPYAKGGLDPLQ